MPKVTHNKSDSEHNEMISLARQKAIEFQNWAQENATHSRRLNEQGYRLKTTPFSAYELLSTEQLYDKFKEKTMTNKANTMAHLKYRLKRQVHLKELAYEFIQELLSDKRHLQNEVRKLNEIIKTKEKSK